MKRLPTLHMNGEPAVLPDRAICRQSHYFIYRPRISTKKQHERTHFYLFLTTTTTYFNIL